MKKLIFILLGLACLNAYSADITQGALQNNSALCAYGYNTNCGGNAGSYTPPQVRVEHITINYPPKFGALAHSSKKAIIAGSINQNSQSEAAREALNFCRRESGSKDCKVIIGVRNGCVAAAEGRLSRNSYIVTPAASAKAGEAEDKALALCNHKGAKDCRILAYEGCSFPY
ncbi:DUF4189 domain-containing protein [Neisseria sp.]